MQLKILCVCGARPNFMKIAPLMRAFAAREEFEPRLVHTGQHYDAAMSGAFFDELQIPRPDVNLGVGSGSHAVQTAQVMQRFEPVVLHERPGAVLVVGDVNSTLACGLVACKLHVPVIHVEAGLRSFDRRMPEEINRVLIDALSDLLFVSEPSGFENLLREGIARERIHLAGNVMIDTLLAHRELAERSNILERLRVAPGGYGVLTLHRPANVDDPRVLADLLDGLEEIQRELPLIFPAHPRTRAVLAGSAGAEGVGGGPVVARDGPVTVGDGSIAARTSRMPGLRLIEPLGYLDFLKLMSGAAVVLTDSGGIQEETTALGVPCLTLRENTERPITVEQGTNQLVGTSPARIVAAYRRVPSLKFQTRVPELWDGRAAERIADAVLAWANQTRALKSRPRASEVAPPACTAGAS